MDGAHRIAAARAGLTRVPVFRGAQAGNPDSPSSLIGMVPLLRYSS